MSAKQCWVVTDAKPGMENQCLGLAEAMGGLEIARKHIHPRLPWKCLPLIPWLAPWYRLTDASDSLDPPWPDILIATGRATVAASIAIRRASQGRTFVVQIQDPGVSPHHFDLVVPPCHDHCTGDNVFPTRGALHRVTPQRLAEECMRFSSMLARLPLPIVAVLIGGSNRAYYLSPKIARNLADQLLHVHHTTGAGLAITFSRRTDREAAAILRRELKNTPTVFWDGSEKGSAGENPYFAYLAAAEHIIVTADSVSMVSEACSTGKPVYVVALEGESKKFHEFHQGLRRNGITREFRGNLESWKYLPLNDTAQVAKEVWHRLASR